MVKRKEVGEASQATIKRSTKKPQNISDSIVTPHALSPEELRLKLWNDPSEDYQLTSLPVGYVAQVELSKRTHVYNVLRDPSKYYVASAHVDHIYRLFRKDPKHKDATGGQHSVSIAILDMGLVETIFSYLTIEAMALPEYDSAAAIAIGISRITPDEFMSKIISLPLQTLDKL